MGNHPQLHPAASAGFCAGARIYTRGRPDYPAALLDWLRDELQLRDGRTAVELGAGTGKFTTLLARTGARVLALEPVAAMRAQFRPSLEPPAPVLPSPVPRSPMPRSQVPSAPVDMAAGLAEAIPTRAGAADAVVCAQAFHWFATPTALREIHRVLHPGGRLGLVWNVRDESVDWVAAITALLAPYVAGAPSFASGRWREAFAQPQARGLFSEPQLATWRHEAMGPPQRVIVERFLSVSFIAALSAEEQTRVRQRLQDLIDMHPRLRNRARIAFPYVAHAYACTRL